MEKFNLTYIISFLIILVVIFSAFSQHNKTIKFELEFVLGGDTDIAHQIFESAAVTRDADDNIYILDRRQGVIRVFDKKGEFKYEFGSQGQGPGEFSIATHSIFYLPYSIKIAILDNVNRRLSLFDTNGRFIRSFFLPSFMDHIVELPDKNLLLSNFSLNIDHAPLHLYTRNGELIKSFGKIYEPGDNLMDRDPDPLSHSQIGIATKFTTDKDGNIYFSQAWPYKIAKYDSNGSLINEFNAETPFPVRSVLEVEIEGDRERITRRLIPGGQILDITIIDNTIAVCVVHFPEDNPRFIDLFSLDGDHIIRVPLPDEPPYARSLSIDEESLLIVSGGPDEYIEIYKYNLQLVY